MFRLAPVLLVLSSLLFPGTISAQRAVAVGGTVLFADNNHPASGITVSLLTVQLVPVLSDVTSDTGEFQFPNVSGQLIVSIQVPDYEPVAIQVDLSFEVANGLLIYLKPLAKKANPGPHRQPTVSAHELSMPSKARELVDSGKKKLYQDKNASAALADFHHALRIAPQYFEASFELGMAYLMLNKPADAETAFRDCVKSSGDKSAEADIRLGQILLDRVDPDAEKFLRKGIELNPFFWLGHYELGRTLLNQNHLPEALSAAEEARLLAPTVPVVYRLLSNIHLLQQNYSALLEDLNTYIDLDPDSPAGVRAKQVRDRIQQNHSIKNQQFAAVRP